MEPTKTPGIARPPSGRYKGKVKILVLVAFLILAFVSVRYTSYNEYLSVQALQELLDRTGFWAPLLFILFYTAGVCLFVPGSVLTGIGAAIFGPYLGFLYVYLGAMVGSVLSFFIARTLGRDFASSIAGERLKKYDRAIEQNGFSTVLYLRLIYFPFTPMNFGMGITGVRFIDYFLGTAIGIFTGTFVLTFLIGSLKEVWISGDWTGLFSMKILISLLLLLFSFLIPKLAKKLRGE